MFTAKDSAKTVIRVLTEATVAARLTRSRFGQWSRNSAAIGSCSAARGDPSVSATSVAKTGVSCRVRRISTPATITSTLAQNGTRQPQDSSASSGSSAIGRNPAVAMICPPWVPDRVKLVKNAAPVLGRVLQGHRVGAGLLTARGQALQQSAGHQQHRREQPTWP